MTRKDVEERVHDFLSDKRAPLSARVVEMLVDLVLDSTGLNVPNLDDMTIDPHELRQFGRDLTTLASYALTKANAMDNRKAGKIAIAQLDEQRCEQLYNTLPPEWRW